jgi:hypothetical protein
LSSSGFDVIRKHARDAASIRIKELAQELARVRSQNNDSRLETDDVRSQGRMDHSTIKLNDERLKMGTTLSSSNSDFFYEFPTEPDLDKLKVWLMLDHLGSKIRDMSGFANDARVIGHPTLRRAPLDLGFQQQSSSPATPVMLFNSGTDVVSATNGEYIWIPDNPSIRFTGFSGGFSVTLRFNCLDFNSHALTGGGFVFRRIVSKTDTTLVGDDTTTPTDGWQLIAVKSTDGLSRGIVFQVMWNSVTYQKTWFGFNTDAWYQLIATFDKTAGLTAANRIKLYVAGVSGGVVDTTNVFFLPLHPNLRIGARDTVSGFFRGYIHDFRLYLDKVLTQTEVTNLNTNEMTIDNIPKGHVFIIQHAMFNQSMVSKTHKYHIIGKVIKTKRHRFNVLKRVLRSKTHKFTILIGVVKTKTHKFSILNKVTMTKTHKYNMGGTVRIEKTHKYNILQKITTTKTHRYAIGGLQTQYQRFTKSTTAGSNVQQAITFNSTPQAIIVWSDASTVDNTYTNDVVVNYGFSDGTNHACVTGLSEDGQTTTDTFGGFKDNRVIAFTDENTPSTTPLAEATVSFSSNQAVFNWTTNDTRANYIHCLALWGMNNVEVKTFLNDTTSTGNKIYTLNNTSMTPKLLHTITVNTSGSTWTTSNAMNISIGAATSASKQFSVANVCEDGQASADTYTAYYTDHVLVGHDDDTGSLEMSAQFVSFGTGNGQFTLNWTDPRSVTNIPFGVLAIDSPNVDVGMITQPAATGTQVVNTGTNVDTFAGLMVFSNAQTSTGTLNASQLMIGGASGTGSTAQGVIVAGENDAASPTETAKVNRTGKVIRTIAPNNAVASTTTTSEADLSAIGTQDQFTLNWTTANATARKFHYIVFGK